MIHASPGQQTLSDGHLAEQEQERHLLSGDRMFTEVYSSKPWSREQSEIQQPGRIQKLLLEQAPCEERIEKG